MNHLVKKIDKSMVPALIAAGYCRVSRRHRIVARIDRPDWREHMAREHAPWDVEGQGMQWASGSHAPDHYRRCYSRDTFVIPSECAWLFLEFPPSQSGPDEYLPTKDRGATAPPAPPVPPPVQIGYRKGPERRTTVAQAEAEGWQMGYRGAPLTEVYMEPALEDALRRGYKEGAKRVAMDVSQMQRHPRPWGSLVSTVAIWLVWLVFVYFVVTIVYFD